MFLDLDKERIYIPSLSSHFPTKIKQGNTKFMWVKPVTRRGPQSVLAGHRRDARELGLNSDLTVGLWTICSTSPSFSFVICRMKILPSLPHNGFVQHNRDGVHEAHAWLVVSIISQFLAYNILRISVHLFCSPMPMAWQLCFKL